MLNILFTSCIVIPLSIVLQTENQSSVYVLEIVGVLWCTFFLLCALFLSKFIHLNDPIQKNVVSSIGLRRLSSTTELFAGIILNNIYNLVFFRQ